MLVLRSKPVYVYLWQLIGKCCSGAFISHGTSARSNRVGCSYCTIRCTSSLAAVSKKCRLVCTGCLIAFSFGSGSRCQSLRVIVFSLSAILSACAPQVVHPAGEVIKPDSWRCVNDEGMPVHGRPYEKGNLYIHFTVKFPDELDAGTMDALRKLLPPGAASASLNGRMETEDIEQASALAARTAFGGAAGLA